MLIRLATLTLGAVLLFGGSLEAQIPIRKKETAIDASTRVLVTTPFVDGGVAADAVKLGHGLRDRFTRMVGSKYTVIPRELMNVALKHFGYKGDDMLPLASIGALADQVKAGITVVSTLTGSDGSYTVTAQITGLSKTVEVTVTQTAGQSLSALGQAVADALKPNVL